MGVEGRQRVGGQDLAVVDHVDPRVVDVEPGRHLAGGDEVDPAHPGREEVDAAQRVAQLVAGDEPGPAAGLAGCGRCPSMPAMRRLAGGVPRRGRCRRPRCRRRRRGRWHSSTRRRRPSAAASRTSTPVDRRLARSPCRAGIRSAYAVGPRARPGRRRPSAPRTAPRPCSPGRARSALPSTTGHGSRDSRGVIAAAQLGRSASAIGAAALRPAVSLRVAQGQVRRRAGVGERLAGTRRGRPSAPPPRGRSTRARG